jgi:signal transduction histidine kinase
MQQSGSQLPDKSRLSFSSADIIVEYHLVWPWEIMSEATGRILVVDDDRMMRMKLMRAVEQHGHSVETAEDGPAALRMLGERPFDVVLLDILMPGMDGYEILERIKADHRLRDIPVIVISGLDDIESVVRCIEMGAEDYLPKKFDPVLLKARLNASLQRKHLRDLEKAYLQQEIMLRQSEKLATLGRLSAGMAHELNNPAAAVQRGARQLREESIRFVDAQLALDESAPGPEQLRKLRELDALARERAREPIVLDPVDRSDLEAELEEALDNEDVADAWQLAPELVNLGLDGTGLDRLAQEFPEDQYPLILSWLVSRFTVDSIIEEMAVGAGRIAEIVKALKTYAYLDQAPVQNVNIHEGLENTLVMMRSRLRRGVSVQREFAPDLPLIEGYGSELNQVWTNLIDNALSAMKEEGRLTLRTCVKEDWVIVDVIDDGPGIPDDVIGRVFDPFFTTKPPGEGTGLGLNISYNIIVEKHKGRMSVSSEPGRTCFRVELRRRLPTDTPERSEIPEK